MISRMFGIIFLSIGIEGYFANTLGLHASLNYIILFIFIILGIYLILYKPRIRESPFREIGKRRVYYTKPFEEGEDFSTWVDKELQKNEEENN